VDQRGALAQRLLRREDRRKILVLDPDQRTGPPGDRFGLGGDGGDLVPDAAHPVPLQRRVVLAVAKGNVVDVGGGDHGADAGQRFGLAGIDLFDERVHAVGPANRAV